MAFAQEKVCTEVMYNGSHIQLQENAKQFNVLKSSSVSAFVIMQFYNLPNAAEQSAFKDKGIIINEYLGNNAYLVEIQTNLFKSANKNVRSIVSLDNVNKLSKELQLGEYPKHALRSGESVALEISIFGSVDEEVISADLQSLEVSEQRISPFFDHLTCIMPIKNVSKLNNFSWLKYAAPVAPKFEAFDRTSNSQGGVSLTNGYSGANRSLTGKGVNIGVWDGDVEHHYDMVGRITNHEYELHETDHGIHVSASMAGNGTLDPLAEGVAREATMETWNFNTGKNGMSTGEEMVITARDNGIVITQNSYGITHNGGFLFPYIGSDVELDQVASLYPHLLHVFAAGNSRGAYTYGTVSHAAKNILTVGALDQYNQMSTFSSWGPVDNGRLGPHVCANGVDVYSASYFNAYTIMSGTSMATPFVSGVAAQLYELYKNENSGANPSSALIKGAICNTAHDMGPIGPDYAYGYGMINAAQAANLISDGNFVKGTVNNADENRSRIFVPNGVTQVKIMLTWIDPASTAFTESALVNDLDLRVEHKGELFLPLVLDGANPFELATEKIERLNNIEQVVINTPTPGYYDIYVEGYEVAVPDQEYFVVYQLLEDDIKILSPVGDEVFEPGSRVVLYWSAPYVNTEDFIIQLSKDNGETYQTIGKALPSDRMYVWESGADAFGNAKFRIISGKYFSESPVAFSMMHRPVLTAVDAEKEISKLEWAEVTNAESYNVYKINDGEVSLFQNTTNTSFTLDARVETEDNWFAVSAVNETIGIESLRSKALKLFPKKGISKFPFFEDFEADENEYFTLKQPEHGLLSIGYSTERESKHIKFEGAISEVPYTEVGSLSEVWAANTEYIATAKLKEFSTTGLSSLLLSFDLRQCITTSFSNNIFRVYVNGEVVKDVLGVTNHQAFSFGSDVSSPRYFDLTKYVGADVKVEFKAICRYPTGAVPGASHGDVVDIDNVKLYEKATVDMAVLDVTFPTSGLRLGVEPLAIKTVNLGSETVNGTTVGYTLYKGGNAVGNVEENIATPVASMEVFDYSFTQKMDLSEEDLPYHVKAKVVQADDAEEKNDNITSHSAYNFGDIVPMSANGYNQTKTVEEGGLVFTDGGTRIFNYPDNTRSTISFYPGDLKKKVKLSLTDFHLEKDYDYLYLFAGTEVSTTPLYVLNGKLEDLEQTEFISTSIDGVLTVMFSSDEAVNESGWVANMSIVDNEYTNDIGVMKITNPTSSEGLSSQERVQLQVGNFGTQAVDSYEVSYTVNGGETVTKTVNNSLRAGGYTLVEFSETENFTEFGKPYLIEATATLIGDEVEGNNSASVSFKSDYVSASGFGFGLHIENVTLAEINQSSGDNMYEDHSDLKAEFEYGKTYTLQVTKNDKLGVGKFWIDWNYDGAFNDTEIFDFDSSDGRTLTAKITPPNSALPGIKRLRIRVATFGEMHPDGGLASGEVEDYTINLTGTAPANDIKISKIEVDNKVREGVNTIGVLVLNDSKDVQSFPLQLKVGEVYSNQISVTNLAPGEQKEFVFDDVTLVSGDYEVEASVDLASDEVQENNTLKKTISVSEITTVYGYSFLGYGSFSSGSLKFNLEDVSTTYMMAQKNNFFVYSGTMAKGNWYVQSRGGTLSTIDLNTGDVTKVGISGIEIRDMTYNPKDDIMYARKYESDEVYSINLETGMATFIGNISVEAIRTLACDISGKLYGVDNIGNFYSVDTSTWIATKLGEVGILPGSSPHPTMFFDHNNGKLYLGSRNNTPTTDDYEIRSINTQNGASTWVGTNNGFGYTLGFAVPYSLEIAESLANVVSFGVTDNPMEASIDYTNNVIHLHVASSVDLTNVNIRFALSPGATATLGGAGMQNGDAVDIISNNTFVVTSMDGSVETSWTIVIEEPINDSAELLSYALITETEDVIGSIKGYSVSAEISASTQYKSILVDFKLSEKAKAYIGNEMIISGETKVDHSKEFMIKVVAEDEVSINYFKVNVNRTANSEASILQFVLDETVNPELTTTIRGEIGTSQITLSDVPESLTLFKPSFITSAGAIVTVNSDIQISGMSENNFSSELVYTVVSEDGSLEQNYTIVLETTPTVLPNPITRESLIVYPNPSRGLINLTNSSSGELFVYNTLGVLELKVEINQVNASVDLSSLSTGIYLIKFTGTDESYVGKVNISE